MAHKPVYCSFCGKADHEVFYIVKGPMAGVCDECVILAADIIQTVRARVARGGPKGPARRSMREFLNEQRERPR